jgi:hypothetical protein
VDGKHRALGDGSQGSNALTPNTGNQFGHRTSGSLTKPSATPGNGVPLVSEVSETSTRINISVAASCHCEDKNGVDVQKRVTGPLLWKSLPNQPDIWSKSHTSPPGPKLADLGGIDTGVRAPQCSAKRSNAGGPLVSRVHTELSTAGETAAAISFRQTDPDISRGISVNAGASSPKSPPLTDLPAAESANRMPERVLDGGVTLRSSPHVADPVFPT